MKLPADLKYTWDEIYNDTYFQKFIAPKDVQEVTLNRYVRDIAYYTHSSGLLPSELIKQARHEAKTIEYDDDRQLETHLHLYIKYLKNDRNFGDYGIKLALQNVKSFYKRFKIDTSDVKHKGVPTTYYLNVKQLPQHEDIRTILSHANIKYKALIAFLGSSGMQTKDVREKTVQDLINAINFQKHRVDTLDDLYEIDNKKEGILPVWDLRRKKSGMPFVTFTSPESLTFLIDYFKYSPPRSEKDYIFRNDTSKWEKTKHQSLKKYFIILNERAGWQDRRIGNAHFITPKTFRTYFANALETARVPEKFIRGMMGHTQPGMRQFYNKLNIDLLLEEYLRAIELLTFVERPTVINHNSEEVKELREMVENLERKVMGKHEEEFKKLPE